LPPPPRHQLTCPSTFQIAEKCEWLTADVDAMIAAGRLTKDEARKVEANLKERLAKLEEELAVAAKEEKAKKVGRGAPPRRVLPCGGGG
jgi:polyhydroxyalkanoate synthesis regulator phasin